MENGFLGSRVEVRLQLGGHPIGFGKNDGGLGCGKSEEAWEITLN